MSPFNDPDITIYHDSAFEGNVLDTRPIGGVETSEIYLSREFAKQGRKVVIFCKCQNPGVFDGVQYLNIADFPAFNKSNKIKIFISQTNPNIFKTQEIDANLSAFWTGGTHTVRANQPLKEKEIYSKIGKFIFKSKWQADEFVKYLGIDKQKVFVSRNGVDLSLFKDTSVKRDRYRLIYTSTPYRGLDVLLDIFPRVRKDFPELKLYVFSDMEVYGMPKGSAMEEYKEYFKKIDQPGVFNMGNVKLKDLAREYMKTYIHAYPSHFEETSCNAAIQAQAAGVPTITSKLAALKETIIDNKTGKLIPGNAHSMLYKFRFINELKKLLADEKKWKEMSSNCLERAKNYYSWEIVAKEWLEELKPYL